ncbi:MAG: C40 family peptidase [Flavobacteriaceae bacterium]|nr:C40 family peptidase [Flavobacteriaceae bacterium]
MKYGICNLSKIPLRLEANDRSEMVSEVIFGDHFEVTEKSKQWVKIKLSYDGYEGWIDKKQCLTIHEAYYNKLSKEPQILSNELVDFIEDEKGILIPILLGARLPFYKNKTIDLNGKKYTFEGDISKRSKPKSEIINTAFKFLNAPYLWGGKTLFGLDCSGFTQMVYKINGRELLRDASQQASQGEVLSFIEESEPGDLAFFDNDEGNIIHVGIILANNYIIHASGMVRVDRLDQSGIYNAELKKHTHKLRVIKKIF